MQAISVPEGVKVLTVSELTGHVREVLEAGFPTVWVEGEVCNCKRHSSGHVYLDLKDAGAKLKGVIWRSNLFRMRFEPRDGLAVIARGRLSVYPPRGEYQLSIEGLYPKGMGAQDLALRQLKEKLARLGYFAAERKRALPRFPRRIALVTSRSGAAVRDMLEILGRRWPAAEVWVCPARVQGDGAAHHLASALRFLNCVAGLDVVILGRGGGAADDLAAFNQESVAQAIFAARMPVVSAVGHEIDVTIADLVADRRALTPSEAAELVTPNREELLKGLGGTADRLANLLWRKVKAAADRLADLARRALARPLERVRDLERRLDESQERLRRAARRRLLKARQESEALAARLESLSPLNVLARGYSLTRKESDQQVVRSAQQVQRGDRLVTTVWHGRIISRVDSIDLPARGANEGPP